MGGPQTLFADQLHAEKYRGEGEGFRESQNRVAQAIADDTDHYHTLRQIMGSQKFMPAGRVQSAMGATRRVTPYNCFVAPTISDSFVDGPDSIMDVLKVAAATMRMGGGIGYDFSTLRPRNAIIRGIESFSTGAVSFMEPYNAVGLCTSSTSHRRGAQMAVLRIDHPDIEEFIHCKQNETRFRGFNISIGVTDEFMHALEAGESFDLRFDGTVYKTVDAKALWEMVMRSTWDWAEPGVLFLDTINQWNNLWYIEKLSATNPCAEQPLPPNGACLLGSFNLTKFVNETPWAADDAVNECFDWDGFKACIAPVVRGMDNIVDRALYPLPAQQAEALNKRRMGLGITGLANAGEALGLRYGSREFLQFEVRVLTVLRDEAYKASALLAKEKGPFPAFSHEYLSGNFVNTLPQGIQQLIRWHGIRNSHLLSIAPTGTISLTADNCSSGIEPTWAVIVERLVQMIDGPRKVVVKDYAMEKWGVECTEANKVSLQEHLDVLAAAAPLVDSAVSKTLNVPADTPWHEFKDIYMQAWKRGIKGLTTYTVGGKREGILEAVIEADDEIVQDGDACVFDFETGMRSCE